MPFQNMFKFEEERFST